MDVQQAGDGADPGPAQADGGSGSRVGLIVGVALSLLAVLVVVVVLLSRDDGDAEPSATATPTATATATVTESPTAGPTVTASPTASPTPAEVPELRADGIGPLELRMTAEQAVATGEATARAGALVPDPDTYPGLTIGYDPDADSIESFVVAGPSPIRTPDGIGVDSSPQDVQDAYGPLVQEQADPDTGEVWYLVAVDDVGYAFVPADDGLVLVCGTDTFLLDLVPSQDL